MSDKDLTPAQREAVQRYIAELQAQPDDEPAADIRDASRQDDRIEPPATMGDSLVDQLNADKDATRAKHAEARANSLEVQRALGLDNAQMSRFLSMGREAQEAMWQEEMLRQGFPDLSRPMGRMRADLATKAGIPVEMPPLPKLPTLLAEVTAAGRLDLLAELVPGARSVEEAEREAAAKRGMQVDPSTGDWIDVEEPISNAIRRQTRRGPERDPVTQRFLPGHSGGLSNADVIEAQGRRIADLEAALRGGGDRDSGPGGPRPDQPARAFGSMAPRNTIMDAARNGGLVGPRGRVR